MKTQEVRVKLTWVAAAVIALVAPFRVDAAIVDYDTFTTDTATALDWLDLTPTFNMTFDTVAEGLQPGGSFDGWRVATRTEAETLFANLGLPIGEGSYPSFNPPPSIDTEAVGRYVSLFGRGIGLSNAGTRGRVEDPALPIGYHAILGVSANVGTTFYRTAGLEQIVADDALHTPYMTGTFLVRPSPVPLPAAAWLLLSGLAVVAAAARRRATRPTAPPASAAAA